VAVLGEVSLRGDLLAVHGIPEKLQAAYQSGCRLVVLPSANRRELQQAMAAAAAEGASRQWLEQTVVLAQDMVDVLSHAVAGE
jgi:ATP-dependent Lon protease